MSEAKAERQQRSLVEIMSTSHLLPVFMTFRWRDLDVGPVRIQWNKVFYECHVNLCEVPLALWPSQNLPVKFIFSVQLFFNLAVCDSSIICMKSPRERWISQWSDKNMIYFPRYYFYETSLHCLVSKNCRELSSQYINKNIYRALLIRERGIKFIRKKKTEKNQFTNSSAAYMRVRQLSLEMALFSICSLQVITAFLFGQLCANLFCSASANRKWKEVWYSGEAAHRAGKAELSPHFASVLLPNLVWSITLSWLKIRSTQFLVHPFSKTGAFQ